jgi:hypothetical protein
VPLRADGKPRKTVGDIPTDAAGKYLIPHGMGSTWMRKLVKEKREREEAAGQPTLVDLWGNSTKIPKVDKAGYKYVALIHDKVGYKGPPIFVAIIQDNVGFKGSPTQDSE